jgi:hypothetical protein
LLLIAAVVAITTVADTVIAVWLLSIPHVFNASSFGNIRVTGVEAYGGDLKTINGSSAIDWGTITIGESRNASLNIRSTSNVPVKLAYNTVNWHPEILAHHITLTWNYNETTILPNEHVSVNFTLTLYSSINTINYLLANNVTAFNFDISIYTTEP